MLDKDKDGEISKKDLMRLLTMTRQNVTVFPMNNLRAIELLPIDRGDAITPKVFITVVA